MPRLTILQNEEREPFPHRQRAGLAEVLDPVAVPRPGLFHVEFCKGLGKKFSFRAPKRCRAVHSVRLHALYRKACEHLKHRRLIRLVSEYRFESCHVSLLFVKAGEHMPVLSPEHGLLFIVLNFGHLLHGLSVRERHAVSVAVVIPVAPQAPFRIIFHPILSIPPAVPIFQNRLLFRSGIRSVKRISVRHGSLRTFYFNPPRTVHQVFFQALCKSQCTD